MRTRLSFFFFVLGGAAASYGIACGSSDFSGNDHDGGTVNGQSCNASDTPAANLCVVQDAFGVFVDSNANASVAEGTMAQPFTTIQAGIDAAKDSKKHVYICVGQYSEQLTLADGVSMFGNMDCKNNWALISQHAVDKAPKSPVATADQIVSPTLIDSLDFIAPDGTSSDRNSVGILVTASTGLTISNATIQAGNGFNGVDGVEGVQLTQAGPINGATAQTGGLTTAGCNPITLNCGPNGVGGGSSSCTAPADAGVDAAPYNGGPGGGGGSGSRCQLQACTGPMGLAEACCSGTGSDAPVNGGAQPGNAQTAQGGIYSPAAAAKMGQSASGANGNNGASHWDGLSFVPGDGTAGTDGAPGQGGGGGAGSNPIESSTDVGDLARGPSGSGGGAGGCPGLAGTPGTGGGASIAIITSDSPFVLDTCVVKSGNGGNAGKGALGSTATPGGSPGASSAAAGASGSSGGLSGWSGNGSAGPSYGIASKGAGPLLQKTGPQAGNGGTGVDARTQGTKTLPAVAPGESATIKTLN